MEKSGTPALLPRLLWAQELPTKDGTPYLRRWVLDLGFGSLRLHHWLCSDDDRAPHDHPYWMVTCILKGGYHDVQWQLVRVFFGDEDHGERWVPLWKHRKAPSIRFWPAEHTHHVHVDEGGCWSLCITGRQSRIWGFWQMRGDGVRRWVRSSRYFRRVGHHVCDR
jgi:hypothetical protein